MISVRNDEYWGMRRNLTVSACRGTSWNVLQIFSSLWHRGWYVLTAFFLFVILNGDKSFIRLAEFREVYLFFPFFIFQAGHLKEWFHNSLFSVFFCQPSASVRKTTAWDKKRRYCTDLNVSDNQDLSPFALLMPLFETCFSDHASGSLPTVNISILLLCTIVIVCASVRICYPDWWWEEPG